MLKCDENSASAAYPPLFTMTMVRGSLRSAADHSAWIEYIDEPSPKSPITLRVDDCASATPTAAGMLWPRPPLAHVKKLFGRSIGRYVCIVLRLDGDSSTRMLSGGRSSDKVCIRYAIEMRSPGLTGAGALRPFGVGRAGGRVRSSNAAAPCRTLHTMAVPTGDHAATSPSSII